MKISRIEITNVKGIESLTIDKILDPNRPNILVAPNGFGKSSFSKAFEALSASKLELKPEDYHNSNPDLIPTLTLNTTTGLNLEATPQKNDLYHHFNVFVLNSQLEIKSSIQRYGGRTVNRTHLGIKPTILIRTIPVEMKFDYSSGQEKEDFGINGRRVLLNIQNLILDNSQIMNEIVDSINFQRFGKRYTDFIEALTQRANGIEGTGREIKDLLIEEIENFGNEPEELVRMCEIIRQHHPELHQIDFRLCAYQVIRLKTKMNRAFKQACDYLSYRHEYSSYLETIRNYNPVSERFDIRPTVKGRSLIVEWPKANLLSNGQRDIITFMALLLHVKRQTKISGKHSILVIDEIFDYMDDGNLITFQYFISNLCDDMRHHGDGKLVFPVLLTHLDPKFFRHFCFNDHKINVHYLQEVEIRSSEHIRRILLNREHPDLNEHLDKYFFHYHPDSKDVDMKTLFIEHSLHLDWATPISFQEKAFREVREYVFNTGKRIAPIFICLGVRVLIERITLHRLGEEHEDEFLETHGTKNKLLLASKYNLVIPESYFLLGLIYNTSLHISNEDDISKPLALKLEYPTIKSMIRSMVNDYYQYFPHQ